MRQANIPRSDVEAASWMRGCGRLLVEEPQTYPVTPETAAEVMAAVTAFRSSLAQALSPGKRTPVAVRRKNEDRAAAERLCRRIYTLVRTDATISDTDKVRLGVRPRVARRSRSDAPKTRPMLSVVTAYGSHRISWRDETALDRQAKPEGSAMLQLFVALGPRPTADLSQARLLNVYTTNSVTLSPEQIGPLSPEGRRFTPMGEAPPVATFFARWSGPRGQPGPWGQPTSLRLAA